MGNSSAKRDTDGPEAEGLDEEEMEALAEEAEGGLDEEEMAALEEEMFDGHQAEDHPGRGPVRSPSVFYFYPLLGSSWEAALSFQVSSVERGA